MRTHDERGAVVSAGERQVSVVCYGKLRETVGESLCLDLPASVRTIADLAHWLGEQNPAAAKALAEPRVRAAIGDTIVPMSAPLGDATEVEFFPPVSGG